MGIIKEITNKVKKTTQNEGVKRYGKNTLWLILDKVIRLIANLFIGIWVARYLGSSNFGIFSYVQSVVFLFTPIASLGIDSILVRDLVRGKLNKEKLFFTSFILKFLGSLSLLLLLFILPNAISNDSYSNFLISVLGISLVFKSFNVIDFYFQSIVKSKFVVISNVFSLFVSSLLKVYFVLSGAPLDYFIYVILFENFILVLAYIYFFRTKVFDFNFSNMMFSKKISKSMLNVSWPLILSGMVVSIYMRIDQIMIKQILGNQANGEYAAAIKLSEGWYFIPTVIVASLFPAIVNAKENGKQMYHNRLQKLYDLMVWLAVLVAIPVSLFSNEIILTLYGENYTNSVSVLKIHIWSSIFVFIGVVYGRFLINENFTKKALYRTCIGALANIVLNYLFIPIYGINGAAVSTLLAQFIANYLYDIFDYEVRDQLIMKTKSLVPIHIIKSIKR